jgi:hypothetical protein
MAAKVGAKTEFIFIKSLKWDEIYSQLKKKKCLRCGIVRVEKNGVVALCAKSS